jgi:hypothetical protein
MDINAIVTEYWPAAVVILGALAVILRQVSKFTKNEVDDKIADVVEDVVDFADPKSRDE